jgi:hypothetical protein
VLQEEDGSRLNADDMLHWNDIDWSQFLVTSVVGMAMMATAGPRNNDDSNIVVPIVVPSNPAEAFANLPDEILLSIINQLNPLDMISLAFALPDALHEL